MATASVTNQFTASTTIVSDDVDTNFSDLVTFLNGSVVHVDGSKVMSGDLDFGSNDIINVKSIEGFVVRGLELTDKTVFTATSAWEDWGAASGVNLGTSSEIIFVTAQALGSILGAVGIARAGQIRVGISLDSGSSWTYGPTNWGQVDDAAAAFRRTAAVAGHQRTGTPTGDVRVKVQALISGGAIADLDFVEGIILAQATAG